MDFRRLSQDDFTVDVHTAAVPPNDLFIVQLNDTNDVIMVLKMSPSAGVIVRPPKYVNRAVDLRGGAMVKTIDYVEG